MCLVLYLPKTNASWQLFWSFIEFILGFSWDVLSLKKKQQLVFFLSQHKTPAVIFESLDITTVPPSPPHAGVVFKLPESPR